MNHMNRKIKNQWRLLIRFFAGLFMLGMPIGLMVQSWELGRGNLSESDYIGMIFGHLLLFALATYVFVKTKK